jgi:hypothetical protein
MSPKTRKPNMSPTRQFLDEFARQIGPGSEVVGAVRAVAWRDAWALNRVHLVRWLRAMHGDKKPPLVTRIDVNGQWFQPAKALLRRLGFDPLSQPDGHRVLRLEWTVLDSELSAFAEYLPLWVRGRLDPSVAIPLPPVPSHVFGTDLRSTNYAWTVTAWDTYSAWTGQSPKLPHYAIPAVEVVAVEPELAAVV